MRVARRFARTRQASAIGAVELVCRLCRVFSELVKELEGAIKKVDNIVEQECHDLFSVAATYVFSHLLLRDPRFEFALVMGPALEEFRGNLATAVGGHVHTPLEKFSCDNGEESSKDSPAIP
ncbi:hypothetical protein D1007_49640 [Hordeum vulgare]|nr:hypothetical protein D1007_49640 [Hordeum vulgare]